MDLSEKWRAHLRQTSKKPPLAPKDEDSAPRPKPPAVVGEGAQRQRRAYAGNQESRRRSNSPSPSFKEDAGSPAKKSKARPAATAAAGTDFEDFDRGASYQKGGSLWTAENQGAPRRPLYQRQHPPSGPVQNKPRRPSHQPALARAPAALPQSDDGPTEIVKQPETRPISEEQLVAEVKGIYAGLVMVESKCIEVDNNQSSQGDLASKLNSDQWQALIALHRTLLHEHHDFFLASQHHSASPALQRLAAKYAMPARMWRHGIHSFLELLRHRLPASLDDMLTFIYMAYSMVALLYETVPAFEDTWIECIGDLGRYRMAIEDDDMGDREAWTAVSHHRYAQASDKVPTVGRLYHHLAILARPNPLQQLHYYLKSLCVETPSPSARDSIMTLFDTIFSAPNPQAKLPPTELAFVKTHGILFSGRQHGEFERSLDSFAQEFDDDIGRANRRWLESGYYIGIANVGAIMRFGHKRNLIVHALRGTSGLRSCKNSEDGSGGGPQGQQQASPPPLQKPLPEDYVMGGLVWSGPYFPNEWFDTDKPMQDWSFEVQFPWKANEFPSAIRLFRLRPGKRESSRHGQGGICSTGIATRTEVAMETPASILMDDNLDSNDSSLKQGGVVNGAAKRFLLFPFAVLTAAKLLWVNLIMDTLAALALATAPKHPDRKPSRTARRGPLRRNKATGITWRPPRGLLCLFTFLMASVVAAHPPDPHRLPRLLLGVSAVGSFSTNIATTQIDNPDVQAGLRIGSSVLLSALLAGYVVGFLQERRDKLTRFVCGVGACGVGLLVAMGLAHAGGLNAFPGPDNAILMGLATVLVGILNAETGWCGPRGGGRHGDAGDAEEMMHLRSGDGDEENGAVVVAPAPAPAPAPTSNSRVEGARALLDFLVNNSFAVFGA